MPSERPAAVRSLPLFSGRHSSIPPGFSRPPPFIHPSPTPPNAALLPATTLCLISSHRYLSFYLSLSVYCCFNCVGVAQASDRRPLSRRPIDGSLSLPMRPASSSGQGEVKVPECFCAFVNKKKLPFTAQFIDKGITYWNMQTSILTFKEEEEEGREGWKEGGRKKKLD